MIFVAMGDDNRLDTMFVVFEIFGIRYYKINSEHLLLGKHYTRVNNNQIVAILNDHHIFADLAQTAQRDKPKLPFFYRRIYFFFALSV